eukprot:GFUD01063660.1.p1 GENE.GFUD01063660.1~~GFUD01063660.1.p1  ORF type:complete len:128 (+),score=11.70 GFUD01063660.1:86-469(+)
MTLLPGCIGHNHFQSIRQSKVSKNRDHPQSKKWLTSIENVSQSMVTLLYQESNSMSTTVNTRVKVMELKHLQLIFSTLESLAMIYSTSSTSFSLKLNERIRQNKHNCATTELDGPSNEGHRPKVARP